MINHDTSTSQILEQVKPKQKCLNYLDKIKVQQQVVRGFIAFHRNLQILTETILLFARNSRDLWRLQYLVQENKFLYTIRDHTAKALSLISGESSQLDIFSG